MMDGCITAEFVRWRILKINTRPQTFGRLFLTQLFGVYPPRAATLGADTFIFVGVPKVALPAPKSKF